MALMVQHDQTRLWKVIFGHQKLTDFVFYLCSYGQLDEDVLNMLQHVYEHDKTFYKPNKTCLKIMESHVSLQKKKKKKTD